MSETRTQEAIEAGVLSFRWECIHEGVQLARISIRPGETSTPHYHPTTHDVLYVMAGILTVTVEVKSDVEKMPYQALCNESPEIVHAEPGKQIHTIRLHPGEILVVNPLVVHCTRNGANTPCSFLCIEGIGDYGFIRPASPHL